MGAPGRDSTMEAENKRFQSPLMIIAGASCLVLLACALYLSVPTASITPDDGATGVLVGDALRIDASPMSTIAKVAVFVDGALVDMEYNLEAGETTREIELQPGQAVRIETKVSSPIGLTRELVSSFETVAPLVVDEVTMDGERLVPGAKIPHRADLAFHFNKPVEAGSVSIDGSEPFQLWLSEDATVGVLKAFLPLEQGATHSFRLTANAVDSAAIDQELLLDVVRPLSLYGQVLEDDAGDPRLELYASVPFRDPAVVRGLIASDLPGATVSVEERKIVITWSGADPGRSYSVSLASASGKDGSTLATPLNLTLDMRGSQTRLVGTAAGGSGYSGGVAAGARPDSSTGPGAGPPPGWPPCCPWPPA